MSKSLLNPLLILIVLTLSLGLPGPVAAQPAQPKAYAPEDLSRLAERDRIRVIEKEYAEQSRGRSLPDDQLEFYLDQIESGWGFSDIKQDIAESLGGGGGGWRPDPGHGPSAPEVLCESRNNQHRECRTDFRGRAVLARQTSGSACIEGRTWGSQHGVVWVTGGCRGYFVEGGGGHGGGGEQYSVTCTSENGRFRSCAWDQSYGQPVLLEQTSRTACIEGSTWGYDRRQGLWVDKGCRGRFGTEGY